MEISASLAVPPANSAAPGKTPSKALATSCREFEAGLWRQMLEKALSPLMSSAKSTGNAGSDTYTYFLSNTIAERVSGGTNGFSNLLQAQLAAQNHQTTSTNTSVCTKPATH